MEAIILGYAIKVVAVASVLHLVLPAYETLNGYPRLKRFQPQYQTFVELVGWIALNQRGKVIQQYPSFQSGKQPIDTPPAP